MTVCPLCGARKVKRACPALGREICAVCCGTKRLTEIACPADCAYLSSARTHPPAVVQRQHERDMQFLLPRIADLTERQYRLLLLAQAVVLRHAPALGPAAHDADVAEAAATVAATLETADKGIIYEHRAQSMPAQRLVEEITRAIADLRERAGAEAGRIERDFAVALRRLERLAREASAEAPSAGATETSFLTLAARLMGGASGTRDETPPPAAEKRIVIP